MLLLCDEVMDSVNEVLSLLGQSFDKINLRVRYSKSVEAAKKK